MAVPNRIAGWATITVDGASYPLRGEFGYRPGTMNRESVIGLDAVHGFKEVPTTSQIKGQITDAGNLLVTSFNGMVNVTVIAQLANGKTVVGRNMWTVEVQNVDSTEGRFDVVWEGADVSEQPGF